MPHKIYRKYWDRKVIGSKWKSRKKKALCSCAFLMIHCFKYLQHLESWKEFLEVSCASNCQITFFFPLRVKHWCLKAKPLLITSVLLGSRHTHSAFIWNSMWYLTTVSRSMSLLYETSESSRSLLKLLRYKQFTLIFWNSLLLLWFSDRILR